MNGEERKVGGRGKVVGLTRLQGIVQNLID
jgi:hypothetical protein